MIFGDFIIHVDEGKCSKARSFVQLIEEIGWDQLVGRTHSAAHTLDLILTRSGSLFVSDVHVSGLVSDHHLVTYSVGLYRPVKEKKTFSFRNYDATDLDSLQQDLSSLPLITSPAWAHGDHVETLDDLVNQFMEVRGVVESHAVLKVKDFVLRDPAPSIKADIIDCSRYLQKAESIWRRSGYLQGHHESHKLLVTQYETLLYRVKADYFCSIIDGCAGDQKKLYKIVDSWLGRSKERSLPTHQFPTDLANTFSSFFCVKVDAIKEELVRSRVDIDPTSVIGSISFMDTRNDADLLTEFSIVGMEELSRAIPASPNKSCILDLIPTSILKKVFFSLFQPSHPSLTFLSRPVCFLLFSSMA